jgi:hypothetical protein
VDLQPIIKKNLDFSNGMEPPCAARLTLRGPMPHTSRQTRLVPRIPLVPRATRCLCRSRLALRSPTPAHQRVFIGRQHVDEHMLQLCFVRFKCMLHMFYLDIAKVDLVLHWLCMCVATCTCMFQVF